MSVVLKLCLGHFFVSYTSINKSKHIFGCCTQVTSNKGSLETDIFQNDYILWYLPLPNHTVGFNCNYSSINIILLHYEDTLNFR